ncbi:MAG: hypothetical protein GY821_12685 [Gammaproteobacteria bacterium]|nr:hypothetical protein [Gammaproteobacteria bacterium]
MGRKKSFTKKKPEEQKELSRDDFVSEEVDEAKGEFRLLFKKGNHSLGKNPLLNIKGRPLKRIVEPGDILIAPPSMLISFMDKFERIDALPEYAAPPKKKLKMIKRGSGYEVINEVSGVKLNNDFLTEEEAKELIADEEVD